MVLLETLSGNVRFILSLIFIIMLVSISFQVTLSDSVLIHSTKVDRHLVNIVSGVKLVLEYVKTNETNLGMFRVQILVFEDFHFSNDLSL